MVSEYESEDKNHAKCVSEGKDFQAEERAKGEVPRVRAYFHPEED